MTKYPPELHFGPGTFPFELRFKATSWQALIDELEWAIGLLTAYRDTAIKLKLHLIQPESRMDEVDVLWGYLE